MIEYIKLFFGKHWKLVLVFVIGVIITFSIMSHFHQKDIDIKDSTIEIKDSTIENLKEQHQKDIDIKDSTIKSLEVQNNNLSYQIGYVKEESLECKIEFGDFDLSNNNIINFSTQKDLNFSCIEKDVVIDKLIDKTNSQDESLRISENKNQVLEEENNQLSNENSDLKSKIGIEKNFLNSTITINNLKTYEAENGKFAITVTGIFNGQTSLKINGKDFNNLGRGTQINFTYKNQEYILRINEIYGESAYHNQNYIIIRIIKND